MKQQLEEAKKLKEQAEKPKCKLRRTKLKPRRRGMRLSSTATTSAWLRPRMLFEQRSSPCAVLIVLRLGKKLSIKLGLKLLPS